MFLSLIGKWSLIDIDLIVAKDKGVLSNVDYEDIKSIWKVIGP
jgi:hypothetical protein